MSNIEDEPLPLFDSTLTPLSFERLRMLEEENNRLFEKLRQQRLKIEELKNKIKELEEYANAQAGQLHENACSLSAAEARISSLRFERNKQEDFITKLICVIIVLLGTVLFWYVHKLTSKQGEQGKAVFSLTSNGNVGTEDQKHD
jgi:hypothetical protein